MARIHSGVTAAKILAVRKGLFLRRCPEERVSAPIAESRRIVAVTRREGAEAEAVRRLRDELAGLPVRGRLEARPHDLAAVIFAHKVDHRVPFIVRRQVKTRGARRLYGFPLIEPAVLFRVFGLVIVAEGIFAFEIQVLRHPHQATAPPPPRSGMRWTP